MVVISSPPSLLNAVSRAALFEPPEAHEDAQRRYALTPEDVALAKDHRRSHNRLGFAVQLALVRDLGRPLRAGEAVPGAVLDIVADQVAIDSVRGCGVILELATV
jgi:TnpA family transposase